MFSVFYFFKFSVRYITEKKKNNNMKNTFVVYGLKGTKPPPSIFELNKVLTM